MFLKKLTYTTWGLLVLAITLTLVTLNNVKKENEYDWTQQFEQEGKKNTLILRKEIENLKQDVMGITSLFKSSKKITRSAFKTYTASLLDKNHFIRSFLWIPRIKQHKRPTIESQAQKEGLVNYQFTILNEESKYITAPNKKEYFPIHFIESHFEKNSFFGFDISSQPTLLNLVNQARDSGKIVATNTRDVFNQDPKRMLVVFLSPVYEGEEIPKTVEDKKRSFMGVAVGMYKLNDMIKQTIETYLVPGIYLTVFDKNKAINLYGNLKENALIEKEMGLNISMIHWTLIWQGSLDFQKGPNRLHNWLSAAVLALIIFSAVIFQILSSRTRRIENEVQFRTKELKRLKNELEEKNLSLQELIKIKNELLGMASHDLRNPLTSIQGYSGFLLKKGNKLNEETREEFLKIINSASSNILTLLNELLSLSAIESGQPTLNLQPGNLCKLIDERVKMYDHLAKEKNILIEVNCQKSLIIPFDEIRIGQVLDNILTNAIKFSPIGGIVEINMKKVDELIQVTITDEGSGIKNENLDDLFKPFKKFESKTKEKGTGLGLAIAKKMIELHGGVLSFKPSKNQGASFCFELPMSTRSTQSYP